MTDEHQAVRDLLARASQLPDEITPPVGDLIKLGRQQRKTRTAQRTLVIGVVAVLAIVIPPVIRAKNSEPVMQNQPRMGSLGPTGAQLARFRWSALPPSPLGPRVQPSLTLAGPYVVELGGLRAGRPVNTGAAFNLGGHRWRKIAVAPGNVGFGGALTLRAGNELFVTNGGLPCGPTAGGVTFPCDQHAGLYNSLTNRWRSTRLPQAMDGLTPAAAVWTGRVVVLAELDARHGRLAVASYNPVSGHWQVITPRLPAEHKPTVIRLVATSDRVIMWSQWSGKTEPDGLTDSGIDVLAFTDNRPSPLGPWRTVTGKWPQGVEVGLPIFTGNSILFPPAKQWCVGRCLSDFQLHRGFFVDPETLRRIATVPLDPAAAFGSFIWTGRAIISVSLGGNPLSVMVNHLDSYDLATHTWRALASPGAQGAAIPVWTGSELLVVTRTGATLTLHR